MTDSDRGAYAPQHDAPLTFDTFDARGRGGRRPMPMTLIGSAVVLLVLVVALVMFYRSGVKGAGGPPRAVGEASPAIKTAPGAEEQPASAGAGMEVYSPQNVPATPAPAFTPSPEQPLARPAPQPTPAVAPVTPGLKVETAPLHPPVLPTVAVKPAPAPTPKPVAVAKAAPVAKAAAVESRPAAAKPAVVATRVEPAKPTLAAATSAKTDSTTITTVLKTASTPSVPAKTVTTRTVVATTAPALPTKTVPAKAAVVKTAKLDAEAADAGAPLLKPALKAETAAAPAGHAAVAQIGAFSSPEQVEKGWSAASAAMPGKMGGKSRRVEKLDREGKTLYRTSVAGFGSRTDAAAFCAALSAKGLACIVKG